MLAKKELLQIIALFCIELFIFWPISTAEVFAQDGDTTPPVISNVIVDAGDDNTAITWQTDEPATSLVNYGKTVLIESVKSDSNLVLSHLINLTNLAFNTLYYYKVSSRDEAGNLADIEVSSFTTLTPEPPVKIIRLENGSVTRTTIELTWNESTDKYFDFYKIYRNSEYMANTTRESYEDTELGSGTTYYYEVSAVDEIDQEGEKSDQLYVTTKAPDLTPPNILNKSITSVTESSATIEWTTDEESNSTIAYGESSSYLNNSVSETNLVLQHSISLTNLANGTLYYYKVANCDESGNCVESDVDSFAAGISAEIDINANVPAYYNSKTVPVTGNTRPYSKVKFYVNDQYKGFISRDGTGATGNISFNVPGFQEGNNTLKITVIDSVGYTKEESYTISIDTQPPIVNLSDIPEILAMETLTLNGTVNEEVYVAVYTILLEGADTEAPGKVTELHIDEIGENYIEIAWVDVDDNDFDYYVVYRDGIAIGTTDRSPYYDDYLVNPNSTYTYGIAAVDTSCNEGSKAAIQVSTNETGMVYEEEPIAQSVGCEAGIPQENLSVTTTAFTVDVDLDEGTNDIEIVVTDLAGNSVTFSGTVLYDTEEPSFIWTNMDELSPSYTSEIIIEGQVSEKATIYAYVNDEYQSYVETDDNGSFSIEVELERSDYSYEGTEYGGEAGGEFGDSWENKVLLVALDRVGLNASEEETITYTLCGYGGDWNVEIKDLTPSILIPKYILSGLAKFGFTIKLSWQGAGEEKDVSISNVRVMRMPLSPADEGKYDEDWVSSINDNTYSQDRKFTYTVVKLKARDAEGNTSLEQENNISNHRKGECLIPGFGCVKIPLMVEIDYQYPDPFTTGREVRRAWEEREVFEHEKTQRHCMDFEIQIDQRFPSDKIPKAFLEASIELLNNTIELIDTLLEPINRAKKVAFGLCLAGWFSYYVKRASEFTACFGVNPETCTVDDSSRVRDDKGEETDTIVGERCRQCLEARAATVNWWEKVTWVCDRIMCPSAPTFHKYVRDAQDTVKKEADNDKIKYGEVTSHCALQSLQNLDNINWKLKRNDDEYKECNEYTDDYSRVEVRPLIEGKDTDWGYPVANNPGCCEAEYIREWGSACVGMNELHESYCVTKHDKEDEIDVSGASCGGAGGALRLLSGICTGQEQDRIVIVDQPSGYKGVGFYYIIDEDPNNKDWKAAWAGHYQAVYECKEEDVRLGDCEVVGETKSEWVVRGEKILTVEKDSSEPNVLHHCTEGEGDAREYIGWDDEFGSYSKWLKKQEEDKDQPKRETTQDKWAVYGDYIPRSVWDAVCAPSKEYVVDPTADLITSFRCLCLTAMSAYLTHYRTILMMIKNCFQTILETGDGSAGVCKQVLSVYLCDLIYFAIKCIIEKAGKGPGERGDESIEDGFPGFLKYISDSGAATENKIQTRYGTSNIYKTMFVERKLVHAMCLFAFTGDWDLDFEVLLDEEVEVPIATTCVVTGNRRFITVDPSSRQGVFLYDLGVFIVSGADDLSYKVELVCSGDNSCDSDISASGECDCLRLGDAYGGPGEKTQPISAGPGHLDQGEVVDEEVIKEYKRYYRYDKLRVMITYRDNTGKTVTEKCGQVNLMKIGDDPPFECSFDLADLSYRCDFEWGTYATAYFTGVYLKDNKDDLYVGDKIELEGIIAKESPSRESPQKVYLRYKITKGGEKLKHKETVLDEDRTYDLQSDIHGRPWPGLTITDSASQGNKENYIYPFGTIRTGIDISPSKTQYGVTVSYDGTPGRDSFGDFDIIIKENNGKYRVTTTKECKTSGNSQTLATDYTKGPVYCYVNADNVEVKFTIEGEPTADKITFGVSPPTSYESRDMELYISLHNVDEENTIIEAPIDSMTFNIRVYSTTEPDEERRAREEGAEVAGDCSDAPNTRLSTDTGCSCDGVDCGIKGGNYDNWYCYSRDTKKECRKYGGCTIHETNKQNDKCVCSAETDNDKFDCGAVKNEYADFDDYTRKNWYCYEAKEGEGNKCYKYPKCDVSTEEIEEDNKCLCDGAECPSNNNKYCCVKKEDEKVGCVSAINLCETS